MKIVNELQAKFLPNSTHGDSHNLTPSKANAFYGLVDVIVEMKVINYRKCPGALLSSRKMLDGMFFFKKYFSNL